MSIVKVVKKVAAFICVLSLLSFFNVTGTPYNSNEAYAASSVTIDEESFPDDNFREYLKSYFGKDYLSTSEVESVTSMDVSCKGISDLTGIDNFTSLKSLDCSSNSITELNVSSLRSLETLVCSNNTLAELDLSSNTRLSQKNVILSLSYG